MTDDFIQDAVESLHAGDVRHVLIAWNSTHRDFHRSANLNNKAQVVWVREKVNRLLDDVEARLLQ